MENDKRILVIPSWYPPDGGYFFKEHSEAISKMGWQVDVLVNRLVGVRKLMHTGITAFGGYRVGKEDSLRVIRFSSLKLPGSERQNIRIWARRSCRLYRRYEKQFGRPDLILAHSVTWAGYAAYLIKHEHQIPYLIVEHRSFFVWSTEKARQMVKPFYIPFFQKAYEHCEKLVPVSGSLRMGIEALVPGLKDRIRVIPNMIREDMFLPPLEARKKDPFIFIWAGRLEHVKGVDLLLEAVKLLEKRLKGEFFVKLAGKGTLKEKLEGQAKELGVSERINFLGRLTREEMQKEMQGSNCFVLPSRYEAFGVVLLEAMAAGLPVIASRSGGPDSIVNAENGLLVEVESVEELAGAMEQMIAQISNYPEEKIRSSTLQKYGHTSVMKQYEELFFQVLKE
jgi:L-malate glycosyltransferase